MSRKWAKQGVNWLPLWQAVFRFGIAQETQDTDIPEEPPDEITEPTLAEFLERNRNIKDRPVAPPSLRELNRTLEKESGAHKAEIDPITGTFLFHFDGSVGGGWPWVILRDYREKSADLDPRLNAEALFNKEGLVRVSDDDAARHARQYQVIRKATGLVWHQFILRAFDRAVSTGFAVLYARLQSLSAHYEHLHADVWPLLEVVDWQHGVAVAPDGTMYWSIYAEPSKIEKSSTEALKKAPQAKIHEAIAAAYDEAETIGRKPPNMRELPTDVLRLLKANGYVASARSITELCKAPEHARRRRPPGKTVRSERGSQPK